jgi:hypothetical protein
MTESRYKKTIAVLFHEQDTPTSIQQYLITYYTKFWHEKGTHVVALYGTARYVPADLIIVHVDLSVVPEPYLEFATRYPIVVNGKIRDIRKSCISQNLVFGDSGYQRQVIVKSDCNYAGMPERRYMPQQPNHAQNLFKDPLGYRVYPSYADIPQDILQLQGIVVERFLPELEQGLYHIRFYNFLGNRGNCMRVASKSPVVHINDAVKVEQIQFDPRIEKLRRDLDFDYGKFDYVVRGDEVVLFDTNKTTGFVGGTDDPVMREARMYRAMGIYDYFV